MKATMEFRMTVGACITAALLGVPHANGAQTGISVSALPPEIASEVENGAVLDTSGAYATASFAGFTWAPSSPPKAARASFRTTLSTAEGAFTGDYLAAGVQGLSFLLKHAGTRPPTVTVVLEPTSGPRWFNHALVTTSDTEGEWIENNVSFDLLGGWFPTYGTATEAGWQEALRNVTAIGLNISQVGTVSQAASVDSFRLLLENEVVTPDAVLQERLFARFGVRDPNQLTDAQRALDSSNNGIADWKEILFTQSDPDNALDSLLVQVRQTADGHIEISWPAIARGRYRVLVADSPAGPFTALNGAAQIEAAVRGRKAHVDAENVAGPRFYRVVQLVQ